MVLPTGTAVFAIIFATVDIIVGKTCKRLCWEKIKFALRILFVVVLMYYLGWVGT